MVVFTVHPHACGERVRLLLTVEDEIRFIPTEDETHLNGVTTISDPWNLSSRWVSIDAAFAMCDQTALRGRELGGPRVPEREGAHGEGGCGHYPP